MKIFEPFVILIYSIVSLFRKMIWHKRTSLYVSEKWLEQNRRQTNGDES